MRKMGITTIYPKPRTTIPDSSHKVYPYLLTGRKIAKPNDVWCTDITYVPMERGFMYLVAIMDWYSRFVLSCELCNTMETDFCLVALETASRRWGSAEIFNTDQGSQFTSNTFTEAVSAAGMLMSMDGKGRWIDNRFIERLWRSYKYEDVYIKAYEDVSSLHEGTGKWMDFYSYERPHQSLGDKTPWEIYTGK
jgi:putative transposase